MAHCRCVTVAAPRRANSRATLVNRVLELQKAKDRPVVIAADRNVKYDEVVGLLRRPARAGCEARGSGRQRGG